MTRHCWRFALLSVPLLLICFATANAQGSGAPKTQSWKGGAFVDGAYLLDFNHPSNDLFRSRGTTYKLDEPALNMAAAYLRRTSGPSPWAFELTVQTGQDTRVFGFSPTAPNLAGAKWLRHLGPTDASYVVPVGRGLTIQAGIFNSLIGYDSLYAKDNLNYTRPWSADFSPYFMMGVNASYPLTDRLTAAVFVVNHYFHLADPNSIPSWGGQLAFMPANHWTLKETVLVGPDQTDTSFAFWRFFSDNIAEWKRDPFTVALDYQAGTEQVAAPGKPRSDWMAAQLPAHWTFNKHWSATVRPEVAWDSDGRWTGSAQTIKAVTTTAEYREPIGGATALFRLEYRFDDSRGPSGGFFRGSENTPGIVSLSPSQHLLIFAALFSFDRDFAGK